MQGPLRYMWSRQTGRRRSINSGGKKASLPLAHLKKTNKISHIVSAAWRPVRCGLEPLSQINENVFEVLGTSVSCFFAAQEIQAGETWGVWGDLCRHSLWWPLQEEILHKQGRNSDGGTLACFLRGHEANCLCVCLWLLPSHSCVWYVFMGCQSWLPYERQFSGSCAMVCGRYW